MSEIIFQIQWIVIAVEIFDCATRKSKQPVLVILLSEETEDVVLKRWGVYFLI